MNASTLYESLNLKVELIPEGKTNRPGTKIRPAKITIHNTSNSSIGADANAHSKFVRHTGYYVYKGKRIWVSWHYTVDDRIAIRQLPNDEKGWHAGVGNSESLGIEICMHSGIDQSAANDRAARLSAFLLFENNLVIEDLVTHKTWTGKNCPELLVAPSKWAEFKKLVKRYLEALHGKADASFSAVLQIEDTPFEFMGHMCWADGEE